LGHMKREEIGKEKFPKESRETYLGNPIDDHENIIGGEGKEL